MNQLHPMFKNRESFDTSSFHGMGPGQTLLLFGKNVNESGSKKIDAPDLASPVFKANPYPFYTRLREEAPVWRTTLRDRRAAWLVGR